MSQEPEYLKRLRAQQERQGKAAKSASPETLARVSEEMAERDRRDSTRAVAPLAKAADALVMDSTFLSLSDVVARIVDEVEQRRRDSK